jgi:hypothetical protein
MLPKSQQIHPQNQSYVAQAAVSQCFSGVKFNLLDVARHELLRLPIPSFSLDAGFQSCTLASTHLAPGDFYINA